MDMKIFILEKLFATFSEIVLEIVKATDFDDGTKAVLTSSLASISSVLTTTNNPVRIEEETSGKPPITRKKSLKRPNADETPNGRAKVHKIGNASTSIATEPKNPPVQPTAVIDLVQPTVQQAAVFELRAIAPTKKVFLTNFPAEITSVDIHSHLVTKLPEFNLRCEQIEKVSFKSKRSYSSFIINTGEDLVLFNEIVKSEIWPIHTVVHEFKEQPRQRSNFHQNRRKTRST